MTTISYRGDCTVDPARILGPDQTGRYWRQTNAVYDPRADRTDITLTEVPAAELHERVDADREHTFAKIAQLQAITGLFGGAA